MSKKEATVADRVKEIIVETLIVDETEVTPGSNLYEDLQADSLDVVELGLKLEKTFGFEVQDSDGDKLKTVQDVIDLVEKKVQ